MFNLPPRTVVQFVHDILFLSVVRLKNGRQVLGLTSRPTDWTINATEPVKDLPGSLKLLETTPADNREMQWVREPDDLIHVVSSSCQNAFVLNFLNGSSSACTLMDGTRPDAFFSIRPRDGKFLVQIANARPDATRFNILVNGERRGHAFLEECNVNAIGIPTSAGIQNEISR